MSLRRSALSAGVGVVLALLFAAGCATIGTGAKPAEDIVLERAQARWNGLVKQDWAAAYAYMTPAYRAIVPLERFGSQFVGALQWESAKAHNAKCEEKRCVVAVEIFFRLLLTGHRGRVSSTNVEEIWVLEDGQWFKFQAP